MTGLKNFVRLLVCLIAASSLVARDESPVVTYQPSLKLIEGDQPLNTSYVLSITSPANVPVGSNLTITPVVSAVSAPAGVSTATALSFISLNPMTLVFTGPNQTLTTTVTASVPVGTGAGDYIWALATPGWPSGALDAFGFINAKIALPQVPSPPTVTIGAPLDGSVYNYLLGGSPLSIPLSFTATAPAASPITSIDADINGTAVILTPAGIGTGAVAATGTIQLSQAGIFTVQARATNNADTSANTVEITVNLQVPPPVVTIVQPTSSNYIYTGTTLAIPLSFNATSLLGGITSLTATLNGSPVAVNSTGLGSLLANGAGSLAINAAGSYTLAVTGTSPHGTTSATRSFSVTAGQSTPAPSVTIVQPLNGTVFTRVTGSAATSIPFSFNAVAGTGSTISSIKGVLNGTPVTVNAAGIGSATANGTGSFSITTPGNYTFVASANSGLMAGSTSVNFTVNQTPAPSPDCTVDWLPPISLGKVQKGGSVLPIKFALDCNCDRCSRGRDDDDCKNERDTSVVIFIYEIFANGGTSEPEIFIYSRRGNGSSEDRTYAINGNHYQLNYDTAAGAHRYHIDVYRTLRNSTVPQLLGTKKFTTR